MARRIGIGKPIRTIRTSCVATDHIATPILRIPRIISLGMDANSAMGPPAHRPPPILPWLYLPVGGGVGGGGWEGGHWSYRIATHRSKLDDYVFDIVAILNTIPDVRIRRKHWRYDRAAWKQRIATSDSPVRRASSSTTAVARI